MMKRRIVRGSIALVLLWALVACSLTQLIPGREARVTATPTRTLNPTFTPTSTATLTPLPSFTPTPSNTPTDTPLPSDTPTITPIPSDTATPLPTAIPSATARPTSRPTSRPTNTPVPKPTKTPAPAFTGKIVRGIVRCDGYAAVTGHVKHSGGTAFAGVAVGVWSDLWAGAVSVSQADGKYDVNLTNLPAGTYQVAVVKLETCQQRDGLPTAVDCQRLSLPLGVTKTENCTGSGANQVSEVDFTGP